MQRSAISSKKEDGESRPLFLKCLRKRRGDDRHGVDLLGVAAAGEVVDRRVQTEQDRAVPDVYTKNSCFTVSDVISRFSVMSRRVTPLFIGRIEPFKYILYRT